MKAESIASTRLPSWFTFSRRTLLNRREMLSFQKGMAAKVRKGKASEDDR